MALGWWTGETAGLMAGLRQGEPLMSNVSQVRAAVDRSKARGRVAMIIADNLKTHTAPGSLLVRSMLTELSAHLSLVYTPAYDPDANGTLVALAHLSPHRHASSSQRLCLAAR